MKRALCLTAAFLLGLVASPSLAEDGVVISGEETLGIQQNEMDTNSSKFREYRDFRDGLFLSTFRLEALDTGGGRFFDVVGRNLLRDDQSVRARAGDFSRRWSLWIDHNQIPHDLSNKARTPYIEQGRGLFTLPGRVPIIKDGDDATGTPSLVPTTGQMAINDLLIAEYLGVHLRQTDLSVKRQRTGGMLNLAPAHRLAFRLGYSEERQDGRRATFGTLGDRPPRTLNAQLPEPVDYTTREVRAEAEYVGARIHGQLSYLLSSFENDVRSMRWENMFFSPDSGVDYTGTVAGTPRNVSSFGERSLPPDNQAHTVTLSVGADLPRRSRLTATTVFGYMRQNEELLPYAANTLGGDLGSTFGDSLDWNDTGKLPRAKADAEMRTLRLDGDYTINPFVRTNLRAFVRYYDLNNRTPTSDWRYVTQGTAGTNGDVNYRNFRRNLAYAYDKLNLGLDTRHSLSFWRTTLGARYEREGIARKFREADTDEDIFKASVRTRPSDRLSLSAEYLHGDRRADGYDYMVHSQSYWYSFAQGAADVDNPAFLFENHPDLRRYDVSDRRRNAFDVAASLFPQHDFDLTAAYHYRNDDFDSDVTPVAPLAGTTVPLPNPADADALTPGRQLGLLEEKRRNANVDAHYTAVERWNLSLFAEWEEVAADSRGMVFNENQRREPSNSGIQVPTQLGPWTDPNRLYDVRSEDRTTTLGLGMAYDIVPGKLRLSTDYTLSRGKVQLAYRGYGSDPDYLGRDWETFQFGFNDPETVRHNRHALNASLNYRLTGKLTFGLHYLFDRYRIDDWAQEPAGAWVEEVGSEFYWRDTSLDNRWGNRLVSLGGTLSPSYDAHVGFVAMTHRF